MYGKIMLWLTGWVSLLFLVGCGGKPAEESTGFDDLKPELKYKVATVSYPLQYLTERVVGDQIKVHFTMNRRPGEADWQPSEFDIALLQSADQIIVNGPGARYADWLQRVSVDDSKLCKSCSELATADFIEVKDHRIVHQHGPEGEHSHPFMVAHTWLDPTIAKKQASYIVRQLSTVYPDFKTAFESNFEALAADLDGLASDMKAIQPKGQIVLTVSPEMKFFSRACGLTDHHLLWLGSEEAQPDAVETLKAKLRKLGGDTELPVVVLIPTDYPFELKTILDSAAGDSFQLVNVVINTLDATPSNGDYLSVMKGNLDRLRAAFDQMGVTE